MSISERVAEYLQQSRLLTSYPALTAEFTEQVEQYLQSLQAFMATDTASQASWSYAVPELGEGGACSLFGVLADTPYDLTAILGGKTTANQQALQKLAQITAFYREQSQLAWFGIYQARLNTAAQPVLVKLSYFGAPSRAEFPLTPEFALISNNSAVGLSGKAKVINDVAAYLQLGGEYYTCDPKVQAEACLPLFAQSGKIVGIIDAEDVQKQVFSPAALALLVAVCLTIPEFLPAAS